MDEVRQQRNSIGQARPRARKVRVRINREDAGRSRTAGKHFRAGQQRLDAKLARSARKIVAARHHDNHIGTSLDDLLAAHAKRRFAQPPKYIFAASLAKPFLESSARPRNKDRAIRGTRRAVANRLARP